jgi:chromosomal replication initiation ATPase DnaA
MAIEDHPITNHPLAPPRGRDIIRKVLSERAMNPDDFFGPCRCAQFVEARKSAAIQLREAGYSLHHIGNMMNRHHTTIINCLGRLR